jgi:23S rRNA pseudouridine1911/1915/1917 synthase
VRKKLAGFNRQALHAAALSFVHPVSGTLLEFNSPLPEDFAMIVEALKEL